ncbi:MAG: serine/threonine-protein kinase [Candidatus Solibacter usitatus]|nr:serine/threonine-protein kinase [Candidatus Solibacter usitatus]
MSIGPGTTLGPYEILSLLGEGGMGSVWKARDPRLGRYVAIKVAKEKFNERFDREARAVAALNHPNICTLYDIGPNYLVMEYIEGPTLTARIGKAGMPLEEAMPILRQLIDGIEAAHEKGIYHRDLKPDNIKVTPEGMVKVLDFGLAKAADPLQDLHDPANAPTIRLASLVGIIMGTPSYMSPEQASGQPVDKRADVWSFGVVLWEMLTGKRLFDGQTIAHTLADVINKEIRVDDAPAKVQPLLRRCLVRDARKRMRDIGEARIALDKIESGEVDAAPVLTAAPARQRKWFLPAFAAMTLVAAALGIYLYIATRPVRQQFLKLETNLGAPAPLDSLRATLAISPDGSRIAFIGNSKKGMSLFLRRVDQDTATEIAGTESAAYPFFSPDGRGVGYFDAGSLKKISVEGGSPITLCAVAAGRGASWGEDGNIVASIGNSAGLVLIPASGGKPTVLTELKTGASEHTHRYPSLLPGGRGVLFMSSSTADYTNANVEVYSFKDRKRKVLAQGLYPRYLSSGHLVYLNAGTLFAVPFHLDKLEVRGAPFPVLESVAFRAGRGRALYDVSRTGTVVYYRGSGIDDEGAKVQWIDASGRATPLPAVAVSNRMRLSPDGKRLAHLSMESGRMHLWIYDWPRNAKAKLTFDQEPWEFAWTPDSRAILFSSANRLFWARADGASKPQQIHEDKESLWVNDVSPDGLLMALAKQGLKGSSIVLAKLEYRGAPSGESAPRVGKMEKCCEEGQTAYGARFSPDGKWIAYHAIASTGPLVFVRSVPDSGAKWQVSAGEGGASPIWSPNGRELFYKAPGGRIMMVEYAAKGGVFTPGNARPWTEHRVPGPNSISNMSVAPDGKRLIVLGGAGGQQEASPQAMVLVNFFDEVRRRSQASAQ